MIRQARTGDTVLAKSREMTGRAQYPAVVAGGRRGKDDRKQKIGPGCSSTYFSFSLSLPATQREERVRESSDDESHSP
jgi:hypothetical protein